MLKSELKVGDSILVTSGSSTAERLGFIGKVLTIIRIDPEFYIIPFYVRDGIYACWVDGIQPTELLKALV